MNNKKTERTTTKAEPSPVKPLIGRTEKTIYDLNLHESIMIDGGEIEVMRVASGWNYIFYKSVYSIESGEYWERFQIVFVPFDNSFQ